jgi:hypothetical protein
MYYTSDEVSKNGFKPGGDIEIGRENPMIHHLKEVTLEDHVYQYINKWKVAEILFGVKGAGLDGKGELATWRGFGEPVFGNVDPRVLLYIDNMNAIDFEYENKYIGVEEAIKAKAGFLNKASQLMEFARLAGNEYSDNTNAITGGKFISKYSTLKAWESTSSLKGMSALTFRFRFGQAGLFDSLEEVVKPVLALGCAFAPDFAPNYSNYMQGPLPTVAEYIVKIGSTLLKSAIQELGEASEKALGVASMKFGFGTSDDDEGKQLVATSQKTADDFFKAGEGALKDGIQKLTAFQNALYAGIDNAITTVIKEQGTTMKVFNLRVGHILVGPFTAKGAKMSFDMTQVDERGYPVAGQVTINQMESMFIADKKSILNMFRGDEDAIAHYPKNDENLPKI